MTGAWAGRLRLGLRLGVPPDAFWRLSLAEWRALTEAEAPLALRSGELSALMAAYPDGGGQGGAALRTAGLPAG